MSDRDQKIRERAYQLWEQEDRPDGRHDAHWQAAAREIDEQDRNQSGGTRDISVGAASGIQPSGTTPGDTPGAGMGSIGTGGGSTAGAATGARKRSQR